jgi:hypothetical protein
MTDESAPVAAPVSAPVRAPLASIIAAAGDAAVSFVRAVAPYVLAAVVLNALTGDHDTIKTMGLMILGTALGLIDPTSKKTGRPNG